MNTEPYKNEEIIKAKKILFYLPLLKGVWALVQTKGVKSRLWKMLLVFMGISLLTSIIVHGVTGVSFIAAYKDTPFSYKAVSFITNILVGLYTTYIALTISFEIIEGKHSSFGDILRLKTKESGHFLKFCQTRLLYILRVFIGYCLFIIPGIVWTYRFRFAEVYAFKTGTASKELFKKSSDLAYGVKRKLAVLDGYLFLLVLVACVPVFVGLLWVIPILLLYKVFVFNALEKEVSRTQDLEKIYNNEKSDILEASNESSK